MPGREEGSWKRVSGTTVCRLSTFVGITATSPTDRAKKWSEFEVFVPPKNLPAQIVRLATNQTGLRVGNPRARPPVAKPAERPHPARPKLLLFG